MDKNEFLKHIIKYFKSQDLSTDRGVIEDFKKLYLGLIAANPDGGVDIYHEVISDFMDKKYFIDRNGEAYFTQEGIEYIKKG